MKKKAHKSVSLVNKKTTARRSVRVTKKPLNYNVDCFTDLSPVDDDHSLLNGSENRIKRKVSNKANNRSCSYDESPANALSDALYSETSLEQFSGVQRLSGPKSPDNKVANNGNYFIISSCMLCGYTRKSFTEKTKPQREGKW